WGSGSVETNLGRVAVRRLLDADEEGALDRPFHARTPAPMSGVGAWLEDALDTARVQRLLLGLVLATPPPYAGSSDGSFTSPIPAAYRLLKPFFSTDEQLRRAGIIAEDTILTLPLQM